MKIKVISRETIKPSSPTPHYLRNFKLSLLDQLLPPFYVPIILFYAAPDDQSDHNGIEQEYDHVHRCRSDLLKRSLSETLTRFYPVAGRVNNNILVDCNDEGIDYLEARVDGKMSDFMSVDVQHQLHPSHIVSNTYLATDALLAVQVNMFNCGGIAINFCFSHKIFDASTMITFLKSWAATARGAAPDEIMCPTFDSWSLFPALPAGREISLLEPVDDNNAKGEKVITKTFVFKASKIAALRARIVESRSSTTESMNKYPSRVEAVCAIIWKSIMDANRVKSAWNSLSTSASKPVRSVVNCAVNLRYRMDPPLPHASFGNFVRAGTESQTRMATEDETLDGLVSQLRLAVSKIDGDYIKKLQSGVEELIRSTTLEDEGDDDNNEKVEIWISSLCRFPFYETDFGWGKPLWISCNSADEFKNFIILMDTRCGEGIEAWVSLEEEGMAIFEQDQELLEFVN